MSSSSHDPAAACECGCVVPTNRSNRLLCSACFKPWPPDPDAATRLPWSTNEGAEAPFRRWKRQVAARDARIVAAVLAGAKLTRDVAAQLGTTSYELSPDMRRLASKGRIKRVRYLSDGTTAVWGPPDA